MGDRDTEMAYANFENDLYKIYQSEVMGEALFSAAATLAWDSARKQKWRSLAALEAQTKQRYLEHVSGTPRFPYASKLSGYLFGLFFVAIPWTLAMQFLRDGTAPFMEVFVRLRKHASDQDKDFYQYVVAHEEAIVDFAERELAGDSSSLVSVNELIGGERG